MRTYWLMDQHDGDGPTALVETDGRLHIVDVLRFGPSVTSLADQQEVWDRVIGRVAPTMKPLVEASTLQEEGVAPHSKLRRRDRGVGASGRGGRGEGGGRGPATSRPGGGPTRNRGRGDR